MPLEPDYFITHNGIPSILLTDNKNSRHAITETNKIQPPLKRSSIKSNLTKSSKDLINSKIREGKILSRNSQKCDNECSWNLKRPPNEADNKYEYQRKYDNTIFRHDLPDRIVLPPLPN